MLDGSGAVRPKGGKEPFSENGLCVLNGWGWLRAFIAGVVLALGLARVSPSGKARASQARMRGFESRHPLQKS